MRWKNANTQQAQESAGLALCGGTNKTSEHLDWGYRSGMVKFKSQVQVPSSLWHPLAYLQLTQVLLHGVRYGHNGRSRVSKSLTGGRHERPGFEIRVHGKQYRKNSVLRRISYKGSVFDYHETVRVWKNYIKIMFCYDQINL